MNWREPLLLGDTPQPRRGAAAAASAGTIVMFGGTGSNAEEQPVVLDELVVFAVQANASLSCRINPAEVSGPRPCARSGATFLEYAPGHVLLYGGFGADGKPVDDAYLLDVATLQWSKVYNGHPDLVGPEGERLQRALIAAVACWCACTGRIMFDTLLPYSMNNFSCALLPLCCRTGAAAAVVDGALVLLHAGVGSNKLDTARSLDVLALAASYKFTDKMRTEAVALLEQLESWVDKQSISLDLAQNTDRISSSFDSLLKVLDSLYQVSLSMVLSL